MTVYPRGTAILVPALFLWCAACAGAQSPDEAPSVHLVSERSEACRTLVGEIEAVNLATESEAELAALMERADLAAPAPALAAPRLCGESLRGCVGSRSAAVWGREPLRGCVGQPLRGCVGQPLCGCVGQDGYKVS